MARLARRDTADLPAQSSRLHAALEQATTPDELMSVAALADAIAAKARTLKKANKADGLIDEARAAFGAQVDAVFARVGVIRKAATLLPDGQGSRTDLLGGFTSDDFGVSRVTASMWKAWADRLQRVDLAAVRASWDATVAGPVEDWKQDPSLKAIIGAGSARVAGDVPLPDGTYRCIVIDPPWPMGKIERDVRPRQAGHLDYPTMTIEEIAALPISDLAADGCHVYLWVTHRFLPDGLELLDGWGATYECQLTWRKNVGITPFSWMYDTEHVLFARVGSLPLEQKGLRLSFDAKAVGHSVKPEVFYERVAAASPGPRLEMFARRQRDGFTAWGDEVSA